jgi:hypothetical protein
MKGAKERPAYGDLEKAYDKVASNVMWWTL